jgi:predicted RND superfamily exporter protein
MLKRAIAVVIAKRFWVILAVVLMTAFFGLQVKSLKIVIDPNAMLPQAHPNVVGTNLAETLFGSKHVVVVGISARNGGSIYQRDVLESVVRLSNDLGKVPGVKRHTLSSLSADKVKAISGSGNELRVERMLSAPVSDADFETLKKKVSENPIYQGTLVSKDETVASISFAIKAGQGGFREILDKVQETLDKAHIDSVQLTLSGAPVFFASIEHFAQRMVILFPIALVVIGLIHFEAFRTMQGLILPLLTALLAVVWGLGMIGVSKIPMDAFNATTPILILAVAAGHAVQILKRYYEEFDRLARSDSTLSPAALNDRAVLESLTKMAPVMITAGIVAALGFFSLVTFDVATIRTFGIFTGLGIFSALLLELTFIPALRSYLPPPKPRAEKDPTRMNSWDRFAAAVTGTVLKQRVSIFIGFLIVAVVASIGMFNVNQENSTKSYFGSALPVSADDHFLNSKLAGTNTLYVVFEGDRNDRMKDLTVLKVIEDTQRFIESLPEVGKTASIVDFLKQMNKSMNANTSKDNVLPASQDLISQYLLLYSMSGDPTDFDSYIDYDYKNACLIVWMKNDSSQYAESVVKAIKDQVGARLPAGVRIQIGGSVPQASALSETLIEGKRKNIAQMISVVFLSGVVVFRSFLAGFYLIVPLFVTVILNFGVMGLTGIPLNTPNSVSSAMAIGIGADYAIYFLYRMREEFSRTGGNFDLALQETMRTAGKAVIYVATAIAGGYSVLMLSFNFYVHIWFGILIVISMIVSALSALILVPALLKAFPPWFLAGNIRQRERATTATATSLLLVAGVLLAGNQVRAEALRVDDLMEKSYQATRVDSSISEATFRLVNASGQERVRKTRGVTKLQTNGVDNRRVIRFLSPGDVRNTTTLLDEHAGKEDEIWVYLPALKKARRLASNNKRSSFVGTDLSYGDIVGHRTQDWTHKLLREEPRQGVACYVIESVPKSPEVASESGYSKRVTWVAKDNFVALKVDFSDPAGNPLKTAESSEVKRVDPKKGKWQAMLVKVKNHQTEHTTFVSFDKFEANATVADNIFSVRFLEREE